MPPLVANYTKNEVDLELIHSTKAYYVCHSVARAFSECRLKPSGKVVHPENCLNHAEALMGCYNDVKTVPPTCKTSFASIQQCLDNKGSCEVQMKEYLDCEHPAYKTYESYH
jgi:hypothetical protein